MPGKPDILTQLFEAVEQGNEQEVADLLEEGADPNGENELGFTPLMWACEFSSYQIAKLLIQAGGNVNKVTEMKRTPLSFAIVGNNVPVIKLLIEHKVDLHQRVTEVCIDVL